MKRYAKWLSLILIIVLLAGCSSAASYVKEQYPLVDVQGKGKDTAKIYAAEGKDVPTVAKEIAAEEKPRETSKESKDQMFLVYDDKIVNLQKDPQNEANTLVEIDTIQYAKNNYDSSFLQGYVTATLLQSMFGGSWYQRDSSSDYRGYGTAKSTNGSYSSGQNAQTSPSSSGTKPTTTERTGTFGSKSTTGTAPKSEDSAVTRKNDGSTPKYGTSTGSSKPSTGTRSGSFSSKRK